MSWIESHQSLLHHRKTNRAVRRLKCDRNQFIGALHRGWWWGLDNADAQGSLGEIEPEDLAEACGWPEAHAAEFTAVLLEVGFLDDVDGRFRFHNWPRYTSRWYQAKATREEAAQLGARGNHQRWHVERGLFAADCRFCNEERRPTASQELSRDVSGESLDESPANRLESPPESQPTPPPLPTNSTNLPTSPTVATSRNGHTSGNGKASAADRDMLRWKATEDLGSHYDRLIAKYPKRDIPREWNEYISWLEEEKESRWPSAPLPVAFDGFLESREKRAHEVRPAALRMGNSRS